MRRIVSVLVATACIACAMTSGGLAQIDAENLLSRMNEARGGESKLSEIKGSVMKGKMIMVSQGGISGDVTMTYVYPDKTLIEMSIAGVVITQGYDGNIAWIARIRKRNHETECHWW